jgi:hypothetical protein
VVDTATMKIQGKDMVDKWWKIALWVVGGLFAFFIILGVIVGPVPAKATADNAVKACRSSDYAPKSSQLGIFPIDAHPDGVWIPYEDAPNVYSMSQHVFDGTGGVVEEYNRPPWVCTASMATNGVWKVTWTNGVRTLGTRFVPNADLRSVAMPRDLSGPGE